MTTAPLKSSLAKIRELWEGERPDPAEIGDVLWPVFSEVVLAAEQGLEAGWRPISTAPKMKTILMWAATDIADDGRIRNWKMATGFWHSGYADHIDMSPWEWNGRQLAKYEVQPTHWMPLPAAPTPPTEAGEG